MQHETDSDAIAQALQRGKEELDVAKRQSHVYAMYAREPNIMEVVGKEGSTTTDSGTRTQ